MEESRQERARSERPLFSAHKPPSPFFAWFVFVALPKVLYYLVNPYPSPSLRPSFFFRSSGFVSPPRKLRMGHFPSSAFSHRSSYGARYVFFFSVDGRYPSCKLFAGEKVRLILCPDFVPRRARTSLRFLFFEGSGEPVFSKCR